MVGNNMVDCQEICQIDQSTTEYNDLYDELVKKIALVVKDGVIAELEYKRAVEKLFFYFMYQYKQFKPKDFQTLTWGNAIIIFHKKIILVASIRVRPFRYSPLAIICFF